MRKIKEEWAFLDDMIDKTVQWENTNEKSATSRSHIHAIDTSIAVKAKLAALLRRLDYLELKDKAQVNQVSSPICTNYQVSAHIMEECPLLENQVGQGLRKKNMNKRNGICTCASEYCVLETKE